MKMDCVSPRNSSILKAAFFFSALLVITTGDAKAQQFSAYGGMGIEYYKANSLSDYLNYAAPGSVQPGSFSSAIDFSIGGEYAISRNWAVGLEYDYMLKSAGSNNGIGSQQVNVSYSLPSLAVRRLIRGDGYVLRFGGTFGYHFATLSTTSPYTTRTQDYSAEGIGLKLDGSIDTKLDEKLYARLGVNARAEIIGHMKAADGTELTYLDYNSGNQLPVNMNLFGVGVSFGLVYYF